MPVIVELIKVGATTFLYFLSIAGWGGLLRRIFRMPDTDLIDYIATRLLLGCFSLYVAFICLGSVGLLSRRNITVVLAIGVFSALFQSRSTVEKLSAAFGATTRWTLGQRLFFYAVCILTALQIASGFTPLIFYDTQVYQLSVPVQFLNAGSFVHIPWNVYSNSPMALQLTMGMSWVLDPTGNTFKLLMTVFGCLAVLAAAKIGSELGVWSSLLAALFVVSYPEFFAYQALGVVDLPVASFVLFGAIWWVHALRHENWSACVLSGIAFGLVLGSRYQGIVLIGWTLLAVIAAESRGKAAILRKCFWKTATVVFVISVITAPWLIRNYSHFGNPVFPLLYRWLGGHEWSPDQAIRLERDAMGPTLLEISATDRVMAPVNVFFAKPSNGLYGPILLVGALLAILSGGGDIRTYGSLGLGGLIIWGLIHPTIGTTLFRFNAASIMLLLTCTGAMLAGERLQDLKGLFIGITLGLGSMTIALISLQQTLGVWQSVTNSVARASIWQDNVPSWRVLEFANSNLDQARSKILLIGESRSLWLKVPFIAPSQFNGPQLAEIFTDTSRPEKWRERLLKLGITHLLINTREWRRMRDNWGYFLLPDETINSLNQWLQSLPTLFNDRQGSVLLSLN